jgi:hypothetical protein
MSQKLSIILRGHIRNSFNDKNLYNYIKQLANEYDLKIYIQTWNIFQSDVSWRHMEKNESPVNTSLINTYFNDLSTRIQKIIVLDDTQLSFTGKTSGRMGKTAGSYLGWKRMWYGIYEIASYLKIVEPEPDHFIINTRFDVFNNSVSFSLNSINDKLKNVTNSGITPSSISKNMFLKDVEFFGMDNFYIGNVNTVLKLAEQFNYHLDEIVNKHPRITSHEFYTYHVNNILFFDKLSGSSKSMNMQLIGPNPSAITITPIKPQIPEMQSFSHNTNNKMPLFDKNGNSMDPVILIKQDDNKTTILPASSNNRNNKMPLFDKNEDVSDPVIFVTSEINKNSLLQPSSNNRNNKMPLFDKNDGLTDTSFLVKSDDDQIPVLPPSSHNRNNRMQLLDKNESSMDTSFLVKSDDDHITVLPPSSHNRNNRMQLFEQNESVKNTISSIPTDINQNPVLQSSSHGRTNKMPIFDSNETIKNTVSSINIDINNQIPVLPASSHSRNNKMPLMDANIPLISSTIVNTTQLDTLPSATQTKNTNKMELFDSKLKNSQISSLISNEKQPALVSTITARRSSIPLIDSLVKNNKSINMTNNDLSVLSSTSQTYRSSKPLINIDQNNKSQLNVSKVSDIVLINNNTRNNLISMADVKEQPIPIVENPIPVPIVENPIPVPIVEEPVTLPGIEQKYKKNKTKYINKPIPMSKFSVTLDPSYLNLDYMEMPPTVLNVSDNTKLIHSNKFKTNTQSLAAYYALLAN